MTKILLQNDRIIFDGHADSIQECETITLLCDSLANNLNFKTVRYESGYAEFEKIGKAEKLMFVPAPAEITMVFDSHITAVNSRSPMTVGWTTSGETKTTKANDGTTYTFDVTLSSGYVIDTVTLSDSDEQTGKLTGKTDTTFSILAGSGGIFQTITITSKQGGSSQKSYDLSSSSKWSALSDGEHAVQIVAKGTGYRDSAKSTGVTVTKGGATLINFTINGTSYQAEEGMTWQQWVDSSYNTSGGRYFISGGYLKWTNGSVYGPTSNSSSTNPKATDTPQANAVYTEATSGGGID